MTEELLEKIPVEKCWEITYKFLVRFHVLRGEKGVAPLLGRAEGFISPLWSKEKWYEIIEKIIGEGAKQFIPMIKETFNIPVEDALGAAKLVIVAFTLWLGPELELEIIEKTPGRVVIRCTKCPNWERYKEFDIDPAFIPCEPLHQVVWEKGLKAINPRIIGKLTKSLLRGDPYCEDVFEFKDE